MTSMVELFATLGVVRLVDPIIEDAYRKVEQRIVAEELDASPHGTLWHTSFHVSSMPAARERHCGRMALYELMDVQTPDEIDPAGRAVMDVGKDVETQMVKRLGDAGYLLSAPWDAEHQTSLTVPELWLTGNPDAIIRPNGWNRGHLLEFKGKDHDKILEMQQGALGPDPWHVSQAGGYVDILHFAGESKRLWPELEPVRSGSIVYFSRQRPRVTAEFWLDADFARWTEAVTNLRIWQQHFINGTLPQREPTWRWTEDPCDWCAYKKHVCRPDVRADVTQLRDSHAVEYATQHVESYDYGSRRQRVLARWRDPERDAGDGEEEQDMAEGAARTSIVEMANGSKVQVNHQFSSTKKWIFGGKNEDGTTFDADPGRELETSDGPRVAFNPAHVAAVHEVKA